MESARATGTDSLNVPYTNLKVKDVLLNRGGFSHIYECSFRGSPAVLKAIQLSSRGLNHAQVNQEIAILNGMRHHRILSLIGVCLDLPERIGSVGLVTEYMERGSLFDVLHSDLQPASRPFTERAKVRICLQVAEGMNFLHNCGMKEGVGVLHRDLKSANILMNSEGNCKVSDFGLSVMRDMFNSTTTSGSHQGTIQWTDPAVLKGGRYNRASDVYSFAVFIWECCGGPVEWPIPWIGLNFMEVHGAVYNGKRLAIPDTCNPVMKDIMSCCFGEADSRPSFDELCTQLLALQDQLDSEEYDVFISYRDESDKELAKDLFITLTGRGWRVFYDKTCIPPGTDWKHVFMTAVMKTQVYVCILSKGAINHSSDSEVLSEQERLNIARRSFPMLRPDSPCDNMLLELRLARERYESDNCAIYPVIVGQKDGNGDYSDFFNDGSNPTPDQKDQMNTVVVQSVEDDLVAFLSNQSIPIQERNVTVGQILQSALRCNGSKIGPCKSADVRARIDEAIQGMERTLEGRNRFPMANTMRVNVGAMPSSLSSSSTSTSTSISTSSSISTSFPKIHVGKYSRVTGRFPGNIHGCVWDCCGIKRQDFGGCVGERRHIGKYKHGRFGISGTWDCCRSKGVDGRGCVVTTSAFVQEMGDRYLESGIFDKAVEVYSLSVAIDSSSYAAHVKRYNAYMNKGDALGAMKDAQSCIALNPNSLGGLREAVDMFVRDQDAVAALKASLTLSSCNRTTTEVALQQLQMGLTDELFDAYSSLTGLLPILTRQYDVSIELKVLQDQLVAADTVRRVEINLAIASINKTLDELGVYNRSNLDDKALAMSEEIAKTAVTTFSVQSETQKCLQFRSSTRALIQKVEKYLEIMSKQGKKDVCDLVLEVLRDLKSTLKTEVLERSVKLYIDLGFKMLAQQKFVEASAAFDDGLALDPYDDECKRGKQEL